VLVYTLIFSFVYFKGCEPYRVPPCPYDDTGKNTCSGQPMEQNHRCTRMCYGDQDIDFNEDHRYSTVSSDIIFII